MVLAMTAVVLLNRAAGCLVKTASGFDPSRLAAILQEHGLEAQVEHPVPREFAGRAGRAVAEGAGLVVVGGGDGTISAVAGELAGTGVRLGILPLGTYNHFARDLRIPLELEEAARTLVSGRVVQVDVAEVNGRVFVNTSSIGVYPRAVEEREAHRRRFGSSKRLAMVVAGLKFFRQFPLLRVRMDVGGETLRRVTPFVFVGNNEYTLNLFEVQRRSELNRGCLCVCATTCRGPFCLLKLLWLSVRKRLDRARELDERLASEVTLHLARKYVRVSVDGEILKLAPPLTYRIRPGALSVVVPRVDSQPEP